MEKIVFNSNPQNLVVDFDDVLYILCVLKLTAMDDTHLLKIYIFKSSQ